MVFNCPKPNPDVYRQDEAVCNKVDDLEKEFDELMDTYGYESYFRNTRVMIDTLDRIHDNARPAISSANAAMPISTWFS